MPSPRRILSLAILFGSSVLLSSCATAGMDWNYVPPATERPNPTGPSLVVPSFRVRTTGTELTSSQREKLSKSLYQTLGNAGLYSKVGQDAASPLADTLSVELDVKLDTRYSWIVAWPAIYPCPAYWPFQPYNASGAVSLRAHGTVGSRSFEFATTREDEHAETFYGFFRKEGSTNMLTRSYDDVFIALRDKLAAARAEAPSTAAVRTIRNIAVLPFDADPKEDPALSRAVTDRMVTEFLERGRYQVIEREQIDRILAEQGFQQSGACNTEGCLVQVGQLLGVDAMVSGSIGRIGDLLVVSLRITDVAQGRILFARQIQTDKGVGHLLSTELKAVAQEF